MTATAAPQLDDPAPAAAPIGFADRAGRFWRFRPITLADLAELQTLGLDVEAVSDDLPRLADLFNKRRILAAIVWWFINAEVDAANLSVTDLHAALDGDALARAAVAVRDAVIDFFPYPPQVKADLRRELDKALAAGFVVAPPSSPPSPASTRGG